MSVGPVIRFASITPSRWSNGLGETVELWRTPAGGDFRLRLSIATVAADTDFSALPDIERALMPLQPEGLTLIIDGAISHLAQHQTIRFRGESAVSSVGVVAAGHDLNLMARRGQGEPHLDLVTVADRLDFRYPWAAIVCVAGAPQFNGVELSFGDTIVVEEDTLLLTGSGAVAVAHLAASARASTQ